MLNLPNCITLSRLILVAAFTVLLAFYDPTGRATLPQIIAFWCFVVGAVSDFFDGYLARKFNLVTNFGKLMDPLADKILVCAAFIYLSAIQVCPFWVTIVIMFREFLVTGLRQLAVEKSIVIAADGFGKWKTIFQLSFCIDALYQVAFPTGLIPFFDSFMLGDIGEIFFAFLLWGTIALTLVSGANYCWRVRHLFRTATD